MSMIRVYIKPFLYNGEYASSYTEITKYVEHISDLNIDTDSSDFQLGVFRTSNITLKLNNRSGIFNDVGQDETMFAYKRAKSIVRVTYEYGDFVSYLGAANIDECFLSEEIEVFKGLLNDDAFFEDAKSEFVEFKALGYESLFDIESNYYALSNGMNLSVALYTMLNQPKITDYLTVSQANIVPDVDQAIDDVSSFETKSVKEIVDLLLNASNSVLYIESDTVYVAARDPAAAISYTFYGQASRSGAENIISLSKINNGMNRVFNYVRWNDNENASIDSASVARYGVRTKELSFGFFTTQSKKLNILAAIKTEFGSPKRELELTTDLNEDTFALGIFDRIAIDYPTVLIPWENNEFPICGVAICGEGVLPLGLWAMRFSTDTNWKITRKDISFKDRTVKLKLREI